MRSITRRRSHRVCSGWRGMWPSTTSNTAGINLQPYRKGFAYDQRSDAVVGLGVATRARGVASFQEPHFDRRR